VSYPWRVKWLLAQLDLLVQARYPLVYLLTFEEERVERALKKQPRPLWRWRATEGLRGPDDTLVQDTLEPIQALDAFAGQAEHSALLLLVDFHHALDDTLVVRRLRDLEPLLGAQQQAALVLAPRLYVPRELEKELMILDVPLPGSDEVSRILRIFLKAQGMTMEPDLFERVVKASLGLTEKEIKRTYVRVLIGAGTFTEAQLQDLAVAKRQAIRRSRHLEFYDQVEDMSGVGGMNALKEWLEMRGLAFTQQARDFGLPEPKGVFLLGVQGCGKSLTAKAVASLFKIPLLRLDVGALFSGGGPVEEGLRETIRIAESISPVVMWIDELEKGFMTQGEGASGSAFGTFLTWLQEKTKPVFVVATANEVRTLPPELLRKGRFDEIFFVDLPGAHDRLEILDIHVRRRDRDPDEYDLFQCAEETEKYSGAELEQVVVEALFAAYAEKRPLTTRDLLRVIRDTVPLAITMDDRLKELREWARPRTRPAAHNRRKIDYFEDFNEA
jgi:AAA+ superfamily predicted ATPase